MALTEVTINFNVHQLLGGDFDTRRTKAYVKTNIANGTIQDTSTGETRIGDQTVTIASDGTGSWTTWAPEVGVSNPASWQESLILDYPRTGQRDRQTRTFGPYTLAAANDGDNITDLEDEQAIPAEYQTAFTEAAQAYLDAQAEIAGIDDTDSAVAGLIDDELVGPLTNAALTTHTAAKVTADIADRDTDIGAAAESAYAALPRFPHADGLYAFFPCTPDTVDADGNLWSTEGSYGRAMFTLTVGTPTFTVDDGPFGAPGLLLDTADPTVWVYGGTDHETGAGPFDMGLFQRFTILAAIKPTNGTAADLQCPFGCHAESGPDQARQWAFYWNQNTNDAPRAGAFHISDRGGATPGQTFNYEFGATARAYFNRVTVAGATYDGSSLTQYVDGVSDAWENASSSPAAPFPRRGNPMALTWGLLNDETRVKASIGSSLEGEGEYDPVNPFGGELYGIWIYNRVLTAEEIARHQIVVAQRLGLPIAVFDFMTDRQSSGAATVGDVAVSRRGYMCRTGAAGADTSSSGANPAYKISRGGTTGGEEYATMTHLVRVADANPGIFWFPFEAGAINSKHLTRATFRLNSLNTVPALRVLVIIDHGSGPVYYASEETFAGGGNGAATDWSTAVSREIIFKQSSTATAPGVCGWDAGKWREVTIGSPITLAGATNTVTLESGDLLGIGFYCPGAGGSPVHRIDDLKIWP